MRQLTYLMSLERESHFARAANACNVSQPALSAAIRQLEQELGVKLIERNQKFIGFTKDGARILQWARHVLTSWENLRQEASVLRKRMCGTLRIGVIPTTIPMLAKLTKACLDAHPDIRHKILSLSNEAILSGLDKCEIDIGLTYLEGQNLSHFLAVPLSSESYYLIRRKSASESVFHRHAPHLSLPSPVRHSTVSYPSISWAKAAELPLCLLVSSMQNRRIVDHAFKGAGAEPNVLLETDSVLALYAQIIQESGTFPPLATILPQNFLELFAPMAHVLDVFALKPELSRSIGLIALKSDPLPPMVAAILQLASKLNGKDNNSAMDRSFNWPTAPVGSALAQQPNVHGPVPSRKGKKMIKLLSPKSVPQTNLRT